MIILIGGVPRSGKTTLARKLSGEYRISVIHLDIFREMFEHAMGSLGIANGNNPDDNAEHMWRFVKAYIQESVRQSEDYIIEGADLLPRLVHELLPSPSVKAVFLGYTSADPAEKAREIRKHHAKQEWTAGMTDEALQDFVRGNIARSTYIKSQCAATGIPYVETSPDFTPDLARAAVFFK